MTRVKILGIADPAEHRTCDGELGPKVWCWSDNPLSHACYFLSANLPSKTFFPNSTVFTYEAGHFWSPTLILSPSCIVRPTSATDVAKTIKAIQLTNTPFAVRGGGHMLVRGANSIDHGILIVLSNLSRIAISEDRETVQVGPGLRWSDVYNYLLPFDRAVVGGRIGNVGVPGLLLGGGLSFHSYQYGWAMDNVVEYEVVLADGEIVRVGEDAYADLFWALKGGGANFGIVTNFKLRTVPSIKVLAGGVTVGEGDIDLLFQSLAQFISRNKDPLVHILPQALTPDPRQKSVTLTFFYDSPSNATPASVVSATPEGLHSSFSVTWEAYLAALPELYAAVPAKALVSVAVYWQPIMRLWMEASKATNPVGNALGLDPDKGDYLAWAVVVMWNNTAYDEVVMAWADDTTVKMNDAAKEAGVYDGFKYIGDAAEFNDVFGGYGCESREKLLHISRKYDPDRLFQALMPGGFKIGL
ncbi:uncharacterized protein BCR38DRAFT_463837 [Pseudomassariella vexata]|uniref:FAD-binding PCMH-type domain-containing protein n=1 Tax=Pseudomassariella vexata TaxID=1141098 RepID=A0A1Y2EAL8_9PEZI|nr:uncharacterized protein BCR38DRAFT_463837 [Pseudomassariella vexata]ORY68296.1 hypothetical protein BCR38DRAFT_463837 [Pseudomassariella vexata]